VRRRFEVTVTELEPGQSASVAGVQAKAWAASHPSGAPALVLRLTIGGKILAYTGDTAWTTTIIDAATAADLLIAEAYYRDKAVPYHLRYADIVEHEPDLGARRIVLTHMSADMLEHLDQAQYEAAYDGLVVHVG
jgi:ribonuclease BN (tRNA processing enzyme)